MKTPRLWQPSGICVTSGRPGSATMPRIGKAPAAGYENDPDWDPDVLAWNVFQQGRGYAFADMLFRWLDELPSFVNRRELRDALATTAELGGTRGLCELILEHPAATQQKTGEVRLWANDTKRMLDSLAREAVSHNLVPEYGIDVSSLLPPPLTVDEARQALGLPSVGGDAGVALAYALNALKQNPK